MSLETTPSMKAALGDLYYKEGCDQNGWAYVSLEDIHNSFKDGILVFRKGSHKINVRVPAQLAAEIKEICKPSPKSGFVFDYLACKVGQKERYDNPVIASPLGLCWVKIKAGKGRFSDAEIDTLGRIKIPLALFYIRDVLAPPRQVEIKWDTRTSGEWLDELDDLRDQAESDDEYY
jgi:hypothetical protein